MFILAQFLYRLAFGLALGMAATSPRLVSSGYYRNHLYVLLGVHTAAALVAAAHTRLALWIPITAAVVSYFGSVAWLYEQRAMGRVSLLLISALSLVGMWQPLPLQSQEMPTPMLLRWIDPLSGGLLLGVTIAAMFLGHWYLNAPGMKLQPLRRLIAFSAAAAALRAVVAGASLVWVISATGVPGSMEVLLIVLRWLWGIVGVAVLAWMTWQTLKIPNTQSATGILYVAVIGTFLGELTSQLLSQRLPLPV